MRKGLYTLFIGAIATGLVFDAIKFSNWQFLLTLTAVVIFIDLTILLTPSILKIWNAEFQYNDYVEQIVIENDKYIKATTNRVTAMSEMIQEVNVYFSNLIATTSEERNQLLEEYLKEYASPFGFTIQVWEINHVYIPVDSISDKDKEGLTPSEVQTLANDLGILKGIRQSLIDIELLNTFEFQKHLEKYIASLYNSEIISLIKDDAMIVPVYLNVRDLLIVLKKGKGELLEVDAIHITNLTHLFYSNT